MNRIALVVTALAVFGATGEVSAIPRPPAYGRTGIEVTRIGGACGIGRSRDASGRCRRQFNLFRHYDCFGAYKRKHCTPVQTPSGTVNRCKI